MHGATASTGGCAVLVVLNGPIRLELGAGGTLQCAGQQRSRHRRDRPRDPALPDQPDGRAAGRHRPLDPGPSRQVQLLRGRGRGGHDLAVALRAARPAQGGVGGDGDGGGRAAPDHERVDDQARGDPGNLRRRDARQPAALFDPSRQLRADHSQAAARASAGGQVEQDRHRRLHPRARAHPSPRMGRGRQGRRRARPRRQRLSGDGIARPAPGHRRRRTGRRLRRHHPAVARQQEPCRHACRSAPASIANRRRNSRGTP